MIYGLLYYSGGCGCCQGGVGDVDVDEVLV